MIWGGADVIVIKVKCTMNVSCLDNPETIPPTPVYRKTIQLLKLGTATKWLRCLKSWSWCCVYKPPLEDNAMWPKGPRTKAVIKLAQIRLLLSAMSVGQGHGFPHGERQTPGCGLRSAWDNAIQRMTLTTGTDRNTEGGRLRQVQPDPFPTL